MNTSNVSALPHPSPSILSMIASGQLRPGGARFNANIAIPQSCHERQLQQALLAQMLRLPISARNAFVDAAPDHLKAFLTMRSIESNIVCKPTKNPAQAYSNNYKRKPRTATPAPIKQVERKEVLPAPAAPTQRPSLPTGQHATPAKPTIDTSPLVRAAQAKQGGILNKDTYINPVLVDGCLVPAGNAVRAEQNILQREAAKMERYSQAWKQKAATLAQTTVVPAGQRERSVNLSNTVGRRNAP